MDVRCCEHSGLMPDIALFKGTEHARSLNRPSDWRPTEAILRPCPVSAQDSAARLRPKQGRQMEAVEKLFFATFG